MADIEFEPKPLNPLIAPGSAGGDTIEQQRFRSEQTATEAVVDQFKNTALYGAGRNVVEAFRQEEQADPDFGQGLGGTVERLAVGIPAMFGQRGKWGKDTWDKAAVYDELTDGVPREYWDDIFDNDSLENARFSHNRIKEDLVTAQRVGLSTGMTSAAGFAGALLDVDLPLIFMSGGAFQAAKLSGKAAYAGAKQGLKSSVALRATGAVAGASAGLQAGVIVGAVDALNRETVDWKDAVQVALTTTIMGSGIGAAVPSSMIPLKAAAVDFNERVARGAAEIWEPGNRLRGTDNGASADAPAILRPTPEAQPAKPGLRLDDDIPDDPELEAAMRQGMADAVDVTEGGAVVPEFRAPDSTLSASATQGPPTYPALRDPANRVTSTAVKWITAARQWDYSTDFSFKKKVQMRGFIAKMAMNPIFNLGTNNVNRLLKTRSTVGNFLAGAIFEVPSGLVRGDTATAAVLRDMYTGRMMGIMVDSEKLAHRWAKEVDMPSITVAGRSAGISREGMSAYNRQVYMYMNELQRTGKMSPPSSVSEEIAQEAANMYARVGTEALAIAKGKVGDIPLGGAANVADKAAYIPYRHSGRKIMQLLDDGETTVPELVSGYADSYMSTGTFTDRDLAEQVAEAVVTRAIARSTQADESMIMLFSEDGRSFLETTLRGNGKLSEAEVRSIMSRFDADMQDKGKLGSMKARNELDFATTIQLKSGRHIQLVDLMDDDLPTIMQRYVREIAGGSALARKGVTTKAQRTELIEAMQLEQRALGEEPMEGDLIRAMLSEFDGGPQVGYAFGTSNRGIHGIAEAKSLTSLSVLTFNGFAQLAETGVGIAAVGLNTWYQRGIGAIFDNAIRTGNKQVLDELGFLMGQIGNDQAVFKPHLAIDDSTEYGGNSVGANVMKYARHWIGKGNQLQAYTSLLNVVRGEQQKIAALGMADKVMRTIKQDGGFQIGSRMQSDLGLDADQAARLKELIDNGTIEFGSATGTIGKVEYVNRLNLHLWDADLAEDFGAAITRSSSQITQKTLAGESDRWMHTHVGALTTHLQTFPILAIQKQFMRNMHQMDSQTMAVTLYGLGTAYAAVAMRDAITGRERDPLDRAKAAFGYSNITGWIPAYTDPVLAMAGLGDYRFNQFGPYAEPLSVPTVDVMNKLYRGPVGIAKLAVGQANSTDMAAARSVPFFRLIESAKNMVSFGADELVEQLPKAGKPEEGPGANPPVGDDGGPAAELAAQLEK